MLEKKKGVIAAFPFGDTKKVEVLSSKKDLFTKASVAKLIETNKKFKVTSFSKQVVAKSKKKKNRKL